MNAVGVARHGAAERLFKRLVDVDDDAGEGLRPSARDAVAGNFFRTIGATFLVQLGDALTGPKISLVWLLGAVGAPAYLVGLLVPIRESGSMLPQFAIASFVSTCPLRKWVLVGGAVVQALAVAGIGLSAMFVGGATAGWLIIVLLTVFSLARAFSSIAAKDVLGRTIPKSARGQTSAWAASAAGLVTVGAGAMLVLSPDTRHDAGFYALIVLGASTLWLFAAAIYARMREFPDPQDDKAGGAATAGARLGCLKTDPLLRRFVLARCLLLCTALSAPFYVSLGQAAFGSQPLLLGAFIAASGLASLVSAPFWGRLADRSSRKVMMLGGGMAAATGVAVFAIDALGEGLRGISWLLPVLYFVLAVAHQGARIGRKTYVVDIASGDERTDYVAVSNTVVGLVLLGAGTLGAIGAAFSTPLVILALSMLGFGGACMAYRLPEAEGKGAADHGSAET